MAYRYPYDEETKKIEIQKLPTNRNIWKFIILNTLTLGIYSIWFFSPMPSELDKIDPKHDGSRTMSFLAAYIVAYFTVGIVMSCWHYGIAKRVEEAMVRRNISSNFGTGTFWGWYILGSFIGVGPYIYIHKLCKAMNQLSESYNENPIIE